MSWTKNFCTLWGPTPLKNYTQLLHNCYIRIYCQGTYPGYYEQSCAEYICSGKPFQHCFWLGRELIGNPYQKINYNSCIKFLQNKCKKKASWQVLGIFLGLVTAHAMFANVERIKCTRRITKNPFNFQCKLLHLYSDHTLLNYFPEGYDLVILR